jgi:hypothetical protein
MGAALVVLTVSVVIVVAIAAVLTLRWRDRVRRQGDESLEERYRREVVHSSSDTWRGRRYGAGGSDSPPSSYP